MFFSLPVLEARNLSQIKVQRDQLLVRALFLTYRQPCAHVALPLRLTGGRERERMRSLASLLIRTLILSYQDHTLKTSFNSMTILQALSPNTSYWGVIHTNIVCYIYKHTNRFVCANLIYSQTYKSGDWLSMAHLLI